MLREDVGIAEETIKNRNLGALESLSDSRLSEEAILLKNAFLALGVEPAASVGREEKTKIDLLFFMAAQYDITPKSILFLENGADISKINHLRELLKDFAQIKGRSVEIMRKEEESAREIAAALVEILEAN